MRGLSFPGALHNVTGAACAPPSDAGSARRVLAQHRRQRYPRGHSCGWCQEQYPCPPRRAAESYLRAAGALDGQPPRPAAVKLPGLSHRQLSNRSTVAQAQMLLLRGGR